MNICKHINQLAATAFLVARAARPCATISCWHYRLAVAFLAFVSFSSPAIAQCLAHEIQKLTASDASLGDHFGTSSLILGNLAIVGANQANVEQYLGGAAYVFRKDTSTNQWHQEQKVVAADPGPLDQFAMSTAINPVDPNVIIVGAWGNDDADNCDNSNCQSGSAYIFRFDPDLGMWMQEQKLTASDADSQDRFGWAVSIWGDVAIIGARLNDDPSQNSGTAYIFRYDEDSGTWNEQQILFSPNGGQLGTAISLEGDVVLIGASGDDEQAFNAGAVYVFRMDPITQMWLLEQKLMAAIPSGGAAFGWAARLDGNTALIGAHAAHGNVPGSGAAYIFTYDGNQWTEQQKLTASDGMPQDKFGWSVSLADNIAVISADLDDFDKNDGSGSAYIFTFDGKQWNEKAKLQASDHEPGDVFGISAATDGEHILIGANFNDDAGTNSGSAYIFGGLGDCNNNGIIDICDIADGTATDENNNGLPDECDKPPCPWDMDNSGSVGVGDLLMMFAQWGTPGPADFNADGIVNTADLLILLANWGPCK